MSAEPVQEIAPAEAPAQTSVEFENYRCFSKYRMDGLKRVNLLVGKNSSGKTALLEGIHFLTSGNLSSLVETSRRRGEGVNRHEMEYRVDISNLFFGRRLKDGSRIDLRSSASEQDTVIEFRLELPAKIQVATEEGRSASVLNPGILIRRGSPDSRTWDFASDAAGLVEFPIVFPWLSSLISDILEMFEEMNRRRTPCPFISATNSNPSQLDDMWDELLRWGRRGMAVRALNLIIPGIESIENLVGGSRVSRTVSRITGGPFGPSGFHASLPGEERMVPLGSLGDGARQMLNLAVALVNSAKGSLFLDEIDTGLHYSVMHDMWKLVVASAIESDTQVFATTHSWDCIEGLAEACRRNPAFLEHVAIHRIDRDLPESLCYDGESIRSLMRETLDPR